MITAEQIPDAVADAANEAYEDPMGTPVTLCWKRSIAAALNAWPWAEIDDGFLLMTKFTMLLPLLPKDPRT